MTKGQLKEKCQQLFDQITESMPKDLEKLLASGGVDWESAEDNFLLPKKIICAILMHEQWQYKTHSFTPKEERKSKKEIEGYFAMI